MPNDTQGYNSAELIRLLWYKRLPILLFTLVPATLALLLALWMKPAATTETQLIPLPPGQAEALIPVPLQKTDTATPYFADSARLFQLLGENLQQSMVSLELPPGTLNFNMDTDDKDTPRITLKSHDRNAEHSSQHIQNWLRNAERMTWQDLKTDFNLSRQARLKALTSRLKRLYDQDSFYIDHRLARQQEELNTVLSVLDTTNAQTPDTAAGLSLKADTIPLFALSSDQLKQRAAELKSRIAQLKENRGKGFYTDGIPELRAAIQALENTHFSPIESEQTLSLVRFSQPPQVHIPSMFKRSILFTVTASFLGLLLGITFVLLQSVIQPVCSRGK